MVRRSERQVVEGWFDFDTHFGSGTGFVRLFAEEDVKPRAWLFLTTLQMLRGSRERVGDHRPTGDEYSKLHSAENWRQKRDRARLFADQYSLRSGDPAPPAWPARPA